MTRQLASLQVLRAIAALAVLFFHLGESLLRDYHVLDFSLFPAGADGVDIFFVLSGFIMCYTTERPDQRGAGPFAVKRLVRILPLYWGMTLVVFAIAVFMPSLLNNTTASIEALLKSFAFIPYVAPDGRIHPVLFLGWTLNYEMFFYAVFALCLLVAPRWRIQAVIAVMVALRAIGLIFHPHDPVLHTFTDGMLLEFVWGCGVFWLLQTRPGLLKKLAPLGYLGAALILMQNFDPSIPLARDMKKGIPAAMIVIAVLSWEMKVGRIREFFVKLGDASYSLYLGHIYVVELVSKILITMLGAGWLAVGLGMPIIIVLTCILALFCFKWFERPTNDWLRTRFLGDPSKAKAAPLRQSA